MFAAEQIDALAPATVHPKEVSMVDFFAVTEGDFGRVEVVKHQHDLVTRAHPYTYFSYWLGGGMAHSRVGQDVVPLGPDVALGVNSYASHDLRLGTDAQAVGCLNVYLNDAWLDDQCSAIANAMVLPNPCIPITPAVREACTQLLQHVMAPVRESVGCVEDDVAALVSHTIAAATTPEQLQAMPRRRRMIDYRLRVAIAHMQDNIGSPKVAEEVAEVVGLSRSRFFELFHDQLGTSPLVFWNAMRLEEALNRLNAHDENMTSMAMELGFSTPGNFSRFFRDHRGVTPSTYRRVCHAA